jgi:hypothetical protein
MPYTSTKVKSLGIIFQNKLGSKLYSKYYLQHTKTDFTKG